MRGGGCFCSNAVVCAELIGGRSQLEIGRQLKLMNWNEEEHQEKSRDLDADVSNASPFRSAKTPNWAKNAIWTASSNPLSLPKLLSFFLSFFLYICIYMYVCVYTYI